MKKLIPVFLVLVNYNLLMAQSQYDNWHFGINTSINFSGGFPAVHNTSAINSGYAAASISDTLGNLLFYTNSDTVWAKDNSIMPNGTGLFSDRTIPQDVLIVPLPDSASVYYVFTIGSSPNPGKKALYYSIVDMQQNNGLGDVIQKNTLLDDDVTNKLTAVRNYNQKDFWVIDKNMTAGRFKSYAVTKSGLNIQPVISAAGVPIRNGDYSGSIKASNNSCWLASTTQGLFGNSAVVEIFHFSSTSGIVQEGISTASIKHPYGLEFSPDNKKLYVGENSVAPVHQFNLNHQDLNDVIASQIQVSEYYPATYTFQLAPDGRIYFTTDDTLSLGRISSPNNYSWYCNVDTGIVKGLNYSTSSLPNNFNLTYKNSLSCDETYSDCIDPLDAYMPTAFTPNGDGLNDCFGFSRKLKDSLPFMDLAIFDRWGDRVFYTTDRFGCWDGTYKGKPADQANYVYILRARTNCGYAIKKSYVVLIR
ncbi:T9SS type B sorting domain-containing protein [Ferruginibacter albus]|uniref:T9SS type B sorting domain-containing protein n=1 Tax=Ferruginibacter albus TaxID=2875540 RepID=UPI001CC6A2D6|nr:gliding motility-associated C-terminal domain-containing protein [Ferruginibacter albus]UAY53110.1 gliding motility-associated C-terminal domain-containing protein [Ferruginibacter albus]